jgi:hypothetical protein
VVKQYTVRPESLQAAIERSRCEAVRMNASCQGDYQRSVTRKLDRYAEGRPQAVSTANPRAAILVAPVKGQNCLRSWGSDHSTSVPDAEGLIVCHAWFWSSFGLISPYCFVFLPFGMKILPLNNYTLKCLTFFLIVWGFTIKSLVWV